MKKEEEELIDLLKKVESHKTFIDNPQKMSESIPNTSRLKKEINENSFYEQAENTKKFLDDITNREIKEKSGDKIENNREKIEENNKDENEDKALFNFEVVEINDDNCYDLEKIFDKYCYNFIKVLKKRNFN